MTPTPEQEAIIAEARAQSRNLLVDALPGTAKTSTLVMLAHALSPEPTICLMFNKATAEEAKRRMPSYVECSTINSICHRAWAKAIGKRPAPDTGKNYDLVKALVEEAKGDDKSYLQSVFASLMRALALAKSAGYVPEKMRTIGKTLIAGHEELYNAIAASLDDEPDEFFLNTLDKLLERSITASYAGKIDFDDQVYMATLFNAPFPRYKRGLIDEAQDLSPLNHFMLERMKFEWLCAVGDPRQSIYAFRGADMQSMAKLREKFSMHEMTLSVSFRCPIAGVERARRRAPHFKWFHTAKQGQVVRLEEWTAGHVPDGAAILCRANAPLFACAIRLIKAGRGVQLVGRELGPGLIKVLKKLGPATLTKDEVLAAIEKWETTELKKAKEARKGSILDRAECLRVFAEFGSSLAEAIAYAENLFAATGTIKLMTGHKAKGLEWDVVFHLDPWRIPSRFAREAESSGNPGPMDQELNIEFVIETRFKDTMYLVDLEKMQ